MQVTSVGISGNNTRIGVYNRYGVHRKTGTAYDENGFDILGNHCVTGTKYDEHGYDKRGFDKNGIHFKTRTTKGESLLEELLFGHDGVTLDGVNRFDDRGFDYYGNHRITGTKYDEYGFRKDGIHIDAENRKWSDYL